MSDPIEPTDDETAVLQAILVASRRESIAEREFRRAELELAKATEARHAMEVLASLIPSLRKEVIGR